MKNIWLEGNTLLKLVNQILWCRLVIDVIRVYYIGKCYMNSEHPLLTLEVCLDEEFWRWGNHLFFFFIIRTLKCFWIWIKCDRIEVFYDRLPCYFISFIISNIYKNIDLPLQNPALKHTLVLSLEVCRVGEEKALRGGE